MRSDSAPAPPPARPAQGWGPPELVLLAAVACAYFGLASQTVQGADSGEFATLLAVGGVAHPPGYPLYTALLRLLRWVPASSPAHAASLVTAALGVANAAAWLRAARAWGASSTAAVVAVTVASFSLLAWAASTEPEVFVGLALLAGLLLMVAGQDSPVQGLRRGALTGLVLGMGASHHHTLVLLAPVAVLALVRAAREAGSPRRTLAAAAVGLLAGLLPYAGLLVAWERGTGLIWGGPPGLGALLRHVLRVDYGTFRLAAVSSEGTRLEALQFFAGSLARNALWAPLLVAGLGFIPRRRHRDEVFALAALALAWLLAGPAFAALTNVAPRGLSARIVERFHLLPVVLVVVPMALGVDRILADRPRARLLGLATAAALALASVSLNGPEIASMRRPTVELYLQNVLGWLPPRAVLLSDGDLTFHGFTYLLLGRRVREDVALVSPNTLRFQWYRQPLSKALGLPLPSDESPASTGQLIRSLQRQGRSVYLVDPGASQLGRGFQVVPEGTLGRVLAPDEVAPGPLALMDRNAQLYAAFTYEDAPLLPRNTWGFEAQERYASTWLSLAATLEAEAQPQAAAHARQRASRFLATMR